MDVIELIRAIVGPEIGPSQGQTAPVSPGEQLAAKVLARQPDGLFLMDFGKFQARAEIQVPVQIGDTIAVEVMGAGSPMKFKIIDPLLPGRQAPVMTAFLSMPQVSRDLGAPMEQFLEKADGKIPPAIQSALNRIQPHLAPLDPETDFPPGLGQQVRASVEDSGLFFEKKLAALISRITAAAPEITDQAMAGDKQVQRLISTDLKPALLGLLSAAAEEPQAQSGPLKALVQAAARVLDQIQGNQQSMAQHSRSAGTLTPLTYTGPEPAHGQAPQLRLAQALSLVSALPEPASLSDNTDERIRQAMDRLMETARLLPRRPGSEAARQILTQRLSPLVNALSQSLEPERSTPDPRLESVKQTVQRLIPLVADGPVNPATTPAEAFQSVTFAIPLKQTEKPAGLKVFYRKSTGNKKDDDFRISLLLNMERLGSIRTDFHQVRRRLTLALFTEHSRTRDLIQERTDQLKDALEGRFDDLAITVIHSKRQVDQFAKQPASDKFRGGLDLRV